MSNMMRGYSPHMQVKQYGLKPGLNRRKNIYIFKKEEKLKVKKEI